MVHTLKHLYLNELSENKCLLLLPIAFGETFAQGNKKAFTTVDKWKLFFNIFEKYTKKNRIVAASSISTQAV